MGGTHFINFYTVSSYHSRRNELAEFMKRVARNHSNERIEQSRQSEDERMTFSLVVGTIQEDYFKLLL